MKCEINALNLRRALHVQLITIKILMCVPTSELYSPKALTTNSHFSFVFISLLDNEYESLTKAIIIFD